ncbi:hypothetical protein [Francisella sp. SYW-2]|uniref:hypothetical protein n=1 Tax=Francisella sp. SYW-2 TaxID=2610886 RepID=UPI001CD0608E|nr:hypothetical protein [Francisella sp. SYW-2]
MSEIRPQYHFRKVKNDLLIWDVKKIIELTKHIKPKIINLTEIKEIESEYWYDSSSERPTCKNIVDHMRLINNADLKYPIILCKEGKIIDGMHRVCKALLLNNNEILAIYLEEDIKPHFINVDVNDLPY